MPESETEAGALLPPKTWPENAYPTGQQYASWLAMLTPEQQAEHLDRWIGQAERGAFCTTFHEPTTSPGSGSES